jgi:acyl-CoA reductase-like NAD-dependent aldehyde dehydrogenase
MEDIVKNHIEKAKQITGGQKIPLLINGEFVFTEKTFITEDPAIEESIAEVCVAGEKEVSDSVESAKKAFETWSELPPRERAKYLRQFAENKRPKRISDSRNT